MSGKKRGSHILQQAKYQTGKALLLSFQGKEGMGFNVAFNSLDHIATR